MASTRSTHLTYDPSLDLNPILSSLALAPWSLIYCQLAGYPLVVSSLADPTPPASLPPVCLFIHSISFALKV